MTHSSNWGGYRPGAGRPLKKGIPAKQRTKVIRVDLEMYALLKSGWIEHLISQYQDWCDELDSNSKHQTSPRWERFKQFRSQVQTFGEDKN